MDEDVGFVVDVGVVFEMQDWIGSGDDVIVSDVVIFDWLLVNVGELRCVAAVSDGTVWFGGAGRVPEPSDKARPSN